jgi:hypothetical protein
MLLFTWNSFIVAVNGAASGWLDWLCCTNPLTAELPHLRTELSNDLRNGDAERGEAVQSGDTNLELRHLTVEVTRHEALTQQFDTGHLGFDAASAVVAAPSSPERTAEVFRFLECCVARDRTCRDRLP